MLGYLVNSKTAVIEIPDYAVLNPIKHVTTIAEELHQTGNVKSCHISSFEGKPCMVFNFIKEVNKFSAEAPRLMKEVLPAIPQIKADKEKGIPFRKAVPARTIPIYDKFKATAEDPANLGEQIYTITPKDKSDTRKFTIVNRELQKGKGDTFTLQSEDGTETKVDIESLKDNFTLPKNFDRELVPREITKRQEGEMVTESLEDNLTEEQLAEVTKEHADIEYSDYNPRKKERLKTQLIRKIQQMEKENIDRKKKLEEGIEERRSKKLLKEQSENIPQKVEAPMFVVSLPNPDNPAEKTDYVVTKRIVDRYGEETFILMDNSGNQMEVTLADLERDYTLPQNFNPQLVPEPTEEETVGKTELPEESFDSVSDELKRIKRRDLDPEGFHNEIPKIKRLIRTLDVSTIEDFDRKMKAYNSYHYLQTNPRFNEQGYKNFRDWITQEFNTLESKSGKPITEDARRRTTNDYLKSADLDPELYQAFLDSEGVDPATYKKWISLKDVNKWYVKEYLEDPTDPFAEALVFTYDELLKFGFSKKQADDLASLGKDETATVVDETSPNQGAVNVTKKTTPDNKEIFIIDDPLKGEKEAVTSDSPEATKLKETGLLVSAFTANQLSKIAQLLGTELF